MDEINEYKFLFLLLKMFSRFYFFHRKTEQK